MIGTKVSHFEILSRLGVGGMGEVYAAEDTRLHRKVALKVLPPDMAADPERLERFEREAQAIAALNHPNIVTIHSVEEDGGVHFLTMELVEGKTLTDLITKDGMALNRILELGIPLADAVSAAHQQGITHRDLKPANIMVTTAGRVKILDFGLAKLRETTRAGGTATMLPTQQLTGEGRIVGTVAYMSPEQAEGKSIDHRSDIFALGIILFEMATGERPFKGDTSVSVLSSIIKDTPVSVTDLNRTLPRDLSRIVRRCLAKDPTRRYQTATDLRNELEDVKQALDSGELAALSLAPGSIAAASRSRRFVAAGVALALIAAARARRRRGWPARQRPDTATVAASFTHVTSRAGAEQFPSLSPDGRWIVYSSDVSGNADIYLQSVGGQTAIDLTKDSTSDDTEPVFSPDGDRIAFRSDRQGGGIYVMGRTGESARRLTDVGFNPTWSPDGEHVVYATEEIAAPFGRGGLSELWAVNVASGEKRLVTKGDAVQPSWSPHGQRIAYWAIPADGGQRDIWTIPAAGGPPVAVTSDPAIDWNPLWSPDGTYLYFLSDRGGSMNLWRVAIDESSGKILGPLTALTAPSTGMAHLSISADGRHIAYASTLSTTNIQRIQFDPSRATIQGDPAWITSGSNSYWFLAVSRDGQSLAFSTVGGRQEDLFVCRSDGSDLRQLTNDAAKDRGPQWSPDGKRLAFYSNRNGGTYNIWTINTDGSALQQLTSATTLTIYPVWSPDGSRMSASDITVGTVFLFDPRKLWSQQRPQPLPAFNGPGHFEALSWSPDGKRLAGDLTTKRGGIVTYSLESQAYQHVSEFGFHPVWLSDSRRLLFAFEHKLFLVDSRSQKAREIFSGAPDYPALGALTRDDRQVYIGRTVNDADIWMATLK